MTAPAYRWRVLAVVLVSHLAFGSTTTILGAALDSVAEDLGTTESTLGWTITAPFLALGVWSPVFGKLGDLRGHRLLFFLGTAVFAVATLVSALATNAAMLITLRAIAGIGAAAAFSNGLAQILHEFPESERARAMGWFTMVATGAPAVGLVTGGLLIDAIGWEVVFVIYGLISMCGLAAAALVLRPIPTTRTEELDVLGAATLSSASLALMLGLYLGGEVGMTHPTVLGLFVLAAVSTVAFVRRERRCEHPLIDLRHFDEPDIRGPLIASATLNGAYMAGLITTPILLQDVMGYSLSFAGALLLLRPASFSVASPIGGFLAGHIGERHASMLGLATMGFSMTLFVVAAATTSIVGIGVALVLSGIAAGVSSPSHSTAVANAIGGDDLGVGSGMLSQASTQGTVIGLQLSLLLIGDADPHVEADFPAVYAMGVVLAVLGFTLGSAPMRRRVREEAIA